MQVKEIDPKGSVKEPKGRAGADLVPFWTPWGGYPSHIDSDSRSDTEPRTDMSAPGTAAVRG